MTPKDEYWLAAYRKSQKWLRVYIGMAILGIAMSIVGLAADPPSFISFVALLFNGLLLWNHTRMYKTDQKEIDAIRAKYPVDNNTVIGL